MLAQDLHGDGAWTCDHVRVVEGVNKRQPLLGLKLLRMRSQASE
jgi:hypothetical protein